MYSASYSTSSLTYQQGFQVELFYLTEQNVLQEWVITDSASSTVLYGLSGWWQSSILPAERW
jgi:hypothetical protein